MLKNGVSFNGITEDYHSHAIYLDYFFPYKNNLF
jgi:hypothetical protein